METANATPSRYVRAEDQNSIDRLLEAIHDLTDTRGPPTGLRGDVSASAIVQQLPTAAFVLNDQHEVTCWNEACADLLEFDPTKVLGTTRSSEVFYNTDRPVLADLVLEEADAEEISQWYDEWYERSYGENTYVGEDYFPDLDIWLRFAAAPLKDTDGNIVGALETLEEITEYKQREHELERYETIVEASGDPVYTLDEQGTFTFVNDNVAELTGYEKNELLGHDVSRVLDERTIKRTNRYISELFRTDKQRITVEMDIITAEGERRTCENHIAVLPSDNGRHGTVGVLRDISDRKEREQELRRFENAVSHAGHTIMITNTDGRIESVNPAFEETTGYEAAEAIGQTPSILTSGEHDEAFYRDLWETILDGEVWEGEITNERKNGERFVARETVAPITDRDGQIQGFVSIQDDITARRLREQQLSVFHRVLRHTLRNKGTAIKGHTDLLRHQATDENRREKLNVIQETVEDLIEISEKAHHVRQIVADALNDTTDSELLPSLKRMTAQLSSIYPEAEVILEETTAGQPNIDSRATHALRELIKNGIRHSDAATPRVTITVSATSATTTVTIVDNGPGIPEGEQQVLKSGTETPLEHSSGLGLWFAHWLIHYVGGDIDICADDSGTAITVSLPSGDR
ncbi:PAS domain-containing protein [Halovenus salina]|uniref:PAS domain S-box protein n=1 Tax=Halovenus salina TaxID=1510225 RepID=A0ABD5VZ58_9EURY|nr:PAS domain S-box protein [Halovenus salina]